MLAALEKPDAAWFGEKPTVGRDRLLRTRFRKAVERLRKLQPGNEKEWSWGRLHTTTFRHPLASLGLAYARAFNLGPVPEPATHTRPTRPRTTRNSSTRAARPTGTSST